MGRRRPALTLAALCVALGVVAVASRGDTPLGEAGSRRPSDRLLDYATSTFLALMALAAVAVATLFVAGRKEIAQEMARRGRRRGAAPALLFALVLLSLAFALRGLRPEDVRRAPAQPAPPAATTAATGAVTSAAERPYEPQFEWIPVAVVAALALGGAAALALASRARSRARPEPQPLGEALADVLAETLDDLRAERDARRAVIAAYARLERTLAAHGLARRPPEAPVEYLQRVLTDLGASAAAARRLTLLFERAKFSQHAVGADAKEEAIRALESVQAELRPAEAEAA